MAAPSSGTSTVPSFPPPCPKSPPEYPDLYGKRREAAKIQMLEREIGFLQEELKIVEGLQPASRCCKEVTDFVMANSDPLIPASRKTRRKGRRFWKWLCGLQCFNFSSICCCCCCHSGCSLQLELPRCCDCHCNCNLPNCIPCSTCLAPKSRCCPPCPPSNCCKSNCMKNISCWLPCCCNCKFPSCPNCSSCCTWKCCCKPKCPKVGRCCKCTPCCCNPGCLFF